MVIDWKRIGRDRHDGTLVGCCMVSDSIIATVVRPPWLLQDPSQGEGSVPRRGGAGVCHVIWGKSTTSFPHMEEPPAWLCWCDAGRRETAITVEQHLGVQTYARTCICRIKCPSRDPHDYQSRRVAGLHT